MLGLTGSGKRRLGIQNRDSRATNSPMVWCIRLQAIESRYFHITTNCALRLTLLLSSLTLNTSLSRESDRRMDPTPIHKRVFQNTIPSWDDKKRAVSIAENGPELWIPGSNGKRIFWKPIQEANHSIMDDTRRMSTRNPPRRLSTAVRVSIAPNGTTTTQSTSRMSTMTSTQRR